MVNWSHEDHFGRDNRIGHCQKLQLALHALNKPKNFSRYYESFL